MIGGMVAIEVDCPRRKGLTEGEADSSIAGFVGWLARFARRENIQLTTSARINAVAPTTPPAIAPTGGLLWDVSTAVDPLEVLLVAPEVELVVLDALELVASASFELAWSVNIRAGLGDRCRNTRINDRVQQEGAPKCVQDNSMRTVVKIC